MKWKKVKNVAFFGSWIREDGEVRIESRDVRINGKWRNMFCVYADCGGNVVEMFARLKDAKASYSDVVATR